MSVRDLILWVIFRSVSCTSNQPSELIPLASVQRQHGQLRHDSSPSGREVDCISVCTVLSIYLRHSIPVCKTFFRKDWAYNSTWHHEHRLCRRPRRETSCLQQSCVVRHEVRHDKNGVPAQEAHVPEAVKARVPLLVAAHCRGGKSG